jgi:FkbM family methyltransferase
VLRILKLVKRAQAGAGAMLQRTPSPTKPYKIGEHTILLNREHLLPEYQSRHRLYDRFLPILCKQLDDPDRWMIDVGANVGDTAVAIAQACRNPVLCIEGDDDFFELLKCNIDSVLAKRERAAVCIKATAGSGRYSGSLESDGTTASLAQNRMGKPASTLDSLAREAGAPRGAVALIKVDTDGYDGDVIASAPDILAASRPVIFWENYFSTTAQMQDLEALYQLLHDSGYHHFWVFDNFGNLMLRECSPSNIVDLNEYVASQEIHCCTRTIYYTDILAAPDEKLAAVRAAISVYRSVIARA